MKNNLFLIGVLITALALSSAIAMSSSDKFGDETNEFTTATPVYVMHPVTVFCDTELEGEQLNVYIVPNRNWTVNDSITGAVANATITTNSNGKILTSQIWESPEVGSYDIIIDLDNNGKYSSTDLCSDLLDDNTLAGFTVTQAEESEEDTATTNNDTEQNNTAVQNNTVTQNKTVTKQNASATGVNITQTTETQDGKADYMPFIIIAVAIIIAALIIAITLMRMR
jgi:hypothetical protein